MNNILFDKVIGEKWIEALESGEYEQGTVSLYNDETNQYCCLGVLGVVCGISQENLNGMGYFTDVFSLEDQSDKDFLFQPLISSLETPIKLPDDRITEVQTKLTIMNDSERKSFKEIASWLRENLELENLINT